MLRIGKIVKGADAAQEFLQKCADSMPKRIFS